MHKWGITAKLLLVPVASAVLLVVALGFAARTQSGYEAAIEQRQSRIAAARHYAAVLDGALKLHSRYLDLATARLAGAIGPREIHGLNALLGATLDLNADVDELAHDRSATPTVAADLERVSRELADFQAVLARLALERAPAEIRADVVQSDAEFERLSAALTPMIGTAQLRIDEALDAREGLVRTLLTIVAAVLLLVSVLAIALTLWARRAVARPLGALATTMQRFRLEPATAPPLTAEATGEVGEIIAGFNALAGSVRARERALEESSRALRDGNRALEAEVRERRAAEAQLRRSSELLEAAQSAGGIGVFDLDLSTQLLRGSGSFFTLQGIDAAAEMITQDQWLALVHPDDLESLVSAFTAAVESGASYRAEYRVRRLDRTVRWVSSTGRLFADGATGPRRIVGSLMDITERKQAELTLRETEARLARAVRGTSDGLFEHELDTEQVWFAPRVAELLGYAPAEFPRTLAAFNALVHAEDRARVEATTRAHVERGEPLDVEFRMLDARGDWQWFRSRAQANIDAESGATILSGSLQLVTDRRRSAAELERARAAAEQASQAKSDFLANISHEIRTPINGVIGMTHVLLDSPLSDAQRDCVEILRSSGESLLSLVNDILDFSKIEAGRMELESIDVDVRAAVDEALGAVALAAAGKGLALAGAVADAVPTAVRGDPVRLRQCLVNLLSNAVKFTAHGHVTLDVERLDGAAGEALRFTVSDTGIGIATDRMDRLFREFTQVDSSTTRRYGGTGLGLSIVRRLAGLMGGEAGADSEPGAGSRFWFTARCSAAAAPPSRAPVLAGMAALVADAQPVIARYLAQQLRQLGATVTVLEDPAALGAAVHAAAGAGARRIVALVDAAGLRAAAGLAADGPPVALVLLAPLGLAPATPPPGAIAVLSKPVRRQQLLACLGPLAPADSVTAPATGAALRWRVLLVEDNAVNQRVAEHQLRKLGCEVGIARDGLEAVAAAAGTWDLVLMDCQMPRLDGFEATRRIRAAEAPGRRVPIIALTANALSGDRDTCLGAGMDDHLAKPLDPAALAACVARWAGRTVQAPAAAAEAAAPDTGADRTRAPVDLEALAAVTDGDPVFERELLRVFVASGDAALAALAAALAVPDLATVRRQAHVLKGASANLRADRLAARAAAVEAAAAAGDLDGSQAAAAGLAADYRATTEFLARRRA